MSSKLLGWVILLYFIGSLTYLVAAVFQQSRLNTLARGATLLGWGLHTLSLIWRWIESYQLNIGHAPLANFYESLLFFSWAVICISYLSFWRQVRRLCRQFYCHLGLSAPGLRLLRGACQSRLCP